jgi:hypothetical protein
LQDSQTAARGETVSVNRITSIQHRFGIFGAAPQRTHEDRPNQKAMKRYE